MSTLKKLEYEVYIRIVCPHCIAKELGKKAKRILISLEARGLPKAIRCFNCNKVIDISAIKTEGVEVQNRGDKEANIWH